MPFRGFTYQDGIGVVFQNRLYSRLRGGGTVFFSFFRNTSKQSKVVGTGGNPPFDPAYSSLKGGCAGRLETSRRLVFIAFGSTDTVAAKIGSTALPSPFG
jgi:hypothetical protein